MYICMLSKMFLNSIIVFSFIGISLISFRDYYSEKQINKLAKSPTPSIQLTQIQPTAILDQQIPCSSAYFTFDEGTRWRYTIASTYTAPSSSSAQLKKQIKTTNTITNTIIKNATGAAVVRSVDDKTKQLSETQVICKKSGIFGFPFPIIGNEAISQLKDMSQLASFIKVKPILFLPDDLVISNTKKWTSVIQPEMTIPFMPDNMSLTLTHSAQLLTTTKNAVDVSVQIDTSDLPIPLFQNHSITYTLLPKKGPQDLVIKLNSTLLGNYDMHLRLLEFREGNK